jgi:hypothetical protein
MQLSSRGQVISWFNDQNFTAAIEPGLWFYQYRNKAVNQVFRYCNNRRNRIIGWKTTAKP